MPAAVRRARWMTSGAIWGGGVVAGVGAVVAAPPLLLAWKLLAMGGVGLAVVGEKAGRLAFQRQLARLTRGHIPLAELGRHDDGELVLVRGRVEAAAPLTGLLHATPGVYRRLGFVAAGAWVHEAAVDFTLVDPRGQRITVEAAGARWLSDDREGMPYPAARLDHDGVPEPVRERVRAHGGATVLASERVLPLGAEVEVVGYKTQVADPAGAAADYRSPPLRAALRSGPDLPLVIVSVDAAPRAA
ncbi:MAG: hypothetical protein KBG28_17800 [Kofleriaceae bacterium]|jgi:hypothetical protein|nr:hypothetical protein [Kofleriaceae bacterium]